MSYRIIADSCCDKITCMADWKNITFVPLTLEIGDYRIMDDESFDQDDFVKRTIEYGGVAKTACPSPDAWASAFDCDEDDIYVITITDKLSGTYNSALQGVELYNEEHPDKPKNIYVFNSLATSGIESLTAEFIKQNADNGIAFDEMIPLTEDFIKNHTALYFCLESLDVLKGNGRMYAVAASILKKLKLKMIFRRTEEGNIGHITQDIAMNRALVKLANVMANELGDIDVSTKKIVISHVCCSDRAQLILDKLAANGVHFGEAEIVKCSGLNTTYASNGGIIVSITK